MQKAKQMLRDIRIERLEIMELEEKRELIEARAVKITRDITGMPGSGRKTDLSSSVVGLLQLDEVIKKHIAEVSRKESDILRWISSMESAKYRTLLILYYISGKRPLTWEEVAAKMGYSLPGIFKLHGQALLELQKIIENEKSIVKYSLI